MILLGFDDVRKCVHREFARSLPRTRALRYNPFTERVESLDEESSIDSVLSEVALDARIAEDALHSIRKASNRAPNNEQSAAPPPHSSQ